MKLLLIIFICFFCQFCFGQKHFAKDSANFYLNRLDNSSVVFGHSFFTKGTPDSNAKKIVDNANRYIVGKLIIFLNDTSKVIAAHFLLTKLFEQSKPDLSYSDEDVTDKILISYKYNGLEWKELYDKINLTTELKIDSASVKKIRSYWKSKRKMDCRNLPVNS